MQTIWSLYGFNLTKWPLFAFLFNVLWLIICILILVFLSNVLVLLMSCRGCLSQTVKHSLLVLPCALMYLFVLVYEDIYWFLMQIIEAFISLKSSAEMTFYGLQSQFGYLPLRSDWITTGRNVSIGSELRVLLSLTDSKRSNSKLNIIINIKIL